jgi:hypothetical protein
VIKDAILIACFLIISLRQSLVLAIYIGIVIMTWVAQ